MSEQVVEKQGIKETAEAVIAALSVFDAVSKAKKNDGKIDFNDLGLLIPVLPKVGAALDGSDKIVPEMKDLSAEEAGELIQLVAEGLTGGIVSEKLADRIEKVLIALKANYEAFKAFS